VGDADSKGRPAAATQILAHPAGGRRKDICLLTCYQQPDEETLRQVVDYEKPAATGTRN
jgi:hypothetical protein